jgi:hypothetical protein
MSSFGAELKRAVVTGRVIANTSRLRFRPQTEEQQTSFGDSANARHLLDWCAESRLERELALAHRWFSRYDGKMCRGR